MRYVREKGATVTQAARLVEALRAYPKGLTYGDLQWTGISTCPHKRLEEAGHKYLRTGEQLTRDTKDGRVVFRIVRAR
jgi:hypothetical protein